MDGFVLWLIGMMFTWGLLFKVYDRAPLLLWNMLAAIVFWPFMLAKLMFTKEKEGR